MLAAVKTAAEHWDYVAPLFRMPTDEAEYDTLVEALDDVLTLSGHDENHPLALLAAQMGAMIEAYDHAHHPMPRASGIEVLRYLMQDHGLEQGDLPEVGNQSVISQLLNGKRQLNVRQVRALAERFGVSASVFI
jgi:HTH-type transcriptional regulator/antitoxin HigA